MAYHSIDHALALLHTNAKTSSNTRAERGRIEASVFTITLEYLKELWNNQNGKCYYSDLPLNYANNEWRVSLDRLDTSKGYIPGNLVLTCLELNTRAQWSFEKIQNMMDILDQNITDNPANFEIQKERKQYKKREKKVIDGIEHLICTYCDEFKKPEEFRKNINGCKSCINKKYTTTPRYVLQNLISRSKTNTKIRKAKNNKKRDCSYDIDIEFLIDLYNNQNGLCAYSGLPLKFELCKNTDWAISLERIDPLKGYVKDNVCLICYEFNGPDFTAVYRDEGNFGSGAWSYLKFQYFLAHLKFKQNLITEAELNEVIEMQNAISNRAEYKTRRSSTKLTRFSSDYTKAKRTYSEIHLLTFPDNKKYIYTTEILNETVKTIIYKINGHSSFVANAIKEAENVIYEPLLVCKKELLETYATEMIERYNTMNPNGYNNPKIHTQETRQRISNTLIENTTRYGHNNQVLPKYVKFINWDDRKGYAIVSHPNCKIKYFVNPKYTFAELYEKCIEHLEKIST